MENGYYLHVSAYLVAIIRLILSLNSLYDV